VKPANTYAFDLIEEALIDNPEKGHRGIATNASDVPHNRVSDRLQVRYRADSQEVSMAFATSNLQTNSSCIGGSSQACARTVIQVNRSFSRFKYDLRRILPGSDTGGETAKFQ